MDEFHSFYSDEQRLAIKYFTDKQINRIYIYKYYWNDSICGKS